MRVLINSMTKSLKCDQIQCNQDPLIRAYTLFHIIHKIRFFKILVQNVLKKFNSICYLCFFKQARSANFLQVKSIFFQYICHIFKLLLSVKLFWMFDQTN